LVNLSKVIFTLLLITQVEASTWELKNISLQTENDADIRDDAAYSYGGGFSTLFLRKDSNKSLLHIPFTNYENSQNYISFSFAHKLYTPKDLKASKLLLNDRPYAGYMYLQSGLHQVKTNSLKSLNIQVGILGPSSQMESVQKIIHDLIGSPYPNGWKNQLQNELIIQLNYAQKNYYDLEYFSTSIYNASIIPEFGVELGNASVKTYTNALFRWGKNVPRDFGAYSIKNTGYSKISLLEKHKTSTKWRYYFNFSLQANFIARNIFLDGNSFRKSHSVEKKYLTFDVGYGLSFAYKNFSIDYLRTHTSKEFKTQKDLYSYGSFLFSYAY